MFIFVFNPLSQYFLQTLYDDIKDMFVLALENIAVCVGPIVMEGLQLRNTLYQSIKNLTVQYYGEFKDCFDHSQIFDISVCLSEVVQHIEIKGIDLLIQSINDLVSFHQFFSSYRWNTLYYCSSYVNSHV